MDERLASPLASSSSGFTSPAPSDILKGVVAYVEVRTASDNRSAAIQWVLQRMGARVNEKFSDDVTHVIFKEGKKRTRDKALKLGIHLVSVLWVDSCKEKQQRVPEHEFSANTNHCDTPPPGIRWKKYKSMQPRDFEDELARSAERCQKRQRRRDNSYKQLLQGGESATPFHSPAHVLVVDTQPRSPFSSLDIMTPMVIPNTPPSMQARLNELIREKEERRRGKADESPEGPDVSLDLPPLQRALFRNDTPSQEKAMDQTPVSRRKSLRRSSGVSKQGSSGDLPEVQKLSKSSEDINIHGSSQLRHDTAATVMFETEPQIHATHHLEAVNAASEEENRHRRKSNPETGVSPQNLPQTHVRQKRRAIRQSLPCRLTQTVQSSSSQPAKPVSLRMEQNDNVSQNSATLYPHSSADQTVPMKACLEETRGKKRKKEGSVSLEEIAKTVCDSSRQKTQNKKKKGNADNSAGGNMVSQGTGCVSKNSSSDVPSLNSVNRKRKLLNPSQELHILSPFQTENPSVPRSPRESAVREKRGQKRKSSDVDAVFPSSLPTSKRACRSSQMEENQNKRLSSSQLDANSREQSSKSSSKGSRRSVASKKKTLQKSKGDDNVSAPCSTSQTSILGSSMSMVFNDSTGASFSRFAPPRNSLAEFKVAKPLRPGKRARPIRDCSSQEVERDPKRMSPHKFRLTCMPSLVMTSLHRDEQDFVIRAVKKLGVFRIEDKVSKHTTHVVCGESRRTLNVLNALARGCWLVNKDWVVRSMEDGEWIGEEDFEMVEDMPMCKEARLAREAQDAGSYQCCIFESVGSVFVSNACTPPRPELVKLLQLCGAKVTDSMHRADFYIGDKVHDEKNSIKPVWALDCISQQELLPMEDYILAINHKAKISSSPEF